MSFVDPSGMVCLLELFRFLAAKGMDIFLEEPGGDPASYLERMGFWRFADEYILNKRGNREGQTGRKRSDVLLEITPVSESRDVHRVISTVKKQAGRILQKYLKYPSSELDRFLTSISEVCQNIVEHSGDQGYVAVQRYNYRKTLGRNVVKMVVSDLGRGVKNSLSDRLEEEFGEEWNDEVAIKQALFEDASRFSDPGRGHGLASVRKSTNRWNGRLTLRSGTARVSIVPDWDDRDPEEPGLDPFPGTQVILVLPEKKRGREKQKELFQSQQ